MQEKIIATEQIFDGRVVHLALHTVKLDDGSESKREVVNHSGAVAVVALDEQQNVLLVRQFRLPAGKELLEIPAGTLEKGEDPEACASRELQEEIGYKPLKLKDMGGLYTAPGYTTEFIHLYFTDSLAESRLEQDADEFVVVERMPFAEALAMIERGDIQDGKSVIGLLRVARHLGL